ncbi:MAG: class II fructose-bisphosphate aldolase [Rhodocyclaceae bacterium]|nr:class II fructose-bisphosphate aldolase [Rhodocyclaceae bacterium]
MPLVRLDDLLRHARAHRYAVGAYDAVDAHFIDAILAGAEAAQAPVIISFAESHYAHYDPALLFAAARDAARRAAVPVAIFLDHGASLEAAVAAIRWGANGVMVDASHLPDAENVATTRAVVDMAHALDIPVEGELGYVPGVEGEDAQRHAGALRLTSPEEAKDFVAATGVDFLAVSVGTVHGRLRGAPRLDLERLAAIAEAVSLPLVIHGGTGLLDTQFHALIERGVAKINYYTALADAAAQAAQGELVAGRPWTSALDAARAAIRKEVERTSRVFGAAGRAQAVREACRPWRELEHLILFNWSETASGREAEFEEEGRRALLAVPGVREVDIGEALHENARYRRAWFIRLASPAAEAAYMRDARHLDYADRIFRPHAADRLKIDYIRR